MRESILEAALSGSIEQMGVAIELSELTPEFGGADDATADPLDALLMLAPVGSSSADGSESIGRLFKTIAALLKLPHAADGDLFVWPSLALRDPGALDARERTEAELVLNSEGIAALEQGGAYKGLRIDIGRDGTWHYIGRDDVAVLP